MTEDVSTRTVVTQACGVEARGKESMGEQSWGTVSKSRAGKCGHKISLEARMSGQDTDELPAWSRLIRDRRLAMMPPLSMREAARLAGMSDSTLLPPQTARPRPPRTLPHP